MSETGDIARALAAQGVEVEYVDEGELCPVCGGTGFVETDESGSRCTHCDGSGRV